MATPPPTRAPPTSGMAIAALVCTFLCWPLGLVLGIIALVQINRSNGAQGGKTLAIVSVALSALMIPAMGVLAAIAIPSFERYQLRSKSIEARVNLSSIRLSQESVFADRGRFLPAAAAGGDLATTKAAWDAAPCSPSCTRDGGDCRSFDCLGFRPVDPVYFRYACNVTPEGDNYACAALGDLDGDGHLSLFGVVGKEGLAPPMPDFGGRSPECRRLPPGEVVTCTPGVY